MRTPKDSGIKKQVRLLIYTVALACLTVVALCIGTAYLLVRSSDTFFESSRQVEAFYTHADAMCLAGVEHLLVPTEETYEIYREERVAAQQCIAAAAAPLNAPLAWRMSLLGNMLDSYDEMLNDQVSQRASLEGYYQLRHQEELIQNTAEDYFTMLRNDLQTRNESIRTTWRIQIILSLVMIVLVLTVGISTSYAFGRCITRPVLEMVENVRRIGDGNFELQPIARASAELDVLASAFSQMATTVQNNVKLLQYNAQLDKQLLEQENENLQMQNQLVQAELKGLQAQINPHFLFNTLNLISKKAFLHGEQEISDLMDQTASLLRYSLDKFGKISTLHEELVCIENYFKIQQSRFEGRIQFDLKIEPGLPNIPMPAMVLQPLVENAVIHGVKKVTEGAVVKLRARHTDDLLHICIEDNGVGIPSAELEALLARVMEQPTLLGSELENGHIGLRNVYRRLKMYYGDEMNFSIESEAECGCVVMLELSLDLE